MLLDLYSAEWALDMWAFDGHEDYKSTQPELSLQNRRAKKKCFQAVMSNSIIYGRAHFYGISASTCVAKTSGPMNQVAGVQHPLVEF